MPSSPRKSKSKSVSNSRPGSGSAQVWAQRPSLQRAPPEVVDPGWLLKALAAVLGLGLFCAYLAVVILFYNQQWQFVLNPSRNVPKDPQSAGLTFKPVRFGVDSRGEPQLTGWWVPSDLPSDPTVLLLHGQDGSMSDALPAARKLHEARLNVLLFDYRGYGKSGGAHPTESSMQEDSSDAFRYLKETRKVPASSILVYGTGLAGSLAVSLCQGHPAVAGVILESADGDTLSRVERDPRARLVPVNWLFRERFPLADALHALRTPKLLLSHTAGDPPVDAMRAADPKLTAELGPSSDDAEWVQTVARFLTTYVQHPPATLLPGTK